MAGRAARRIVGFLGLFVLLAIVLPPFVNLDRYKGRIASSLGNALGRNVTVGNVSARLFPQPGFSLQQVVVHDDPAFSAEPMLQASEVVAQLRITSLWRGRLEIARLSLTEPSLNLVRGEDGRWNIETLLTHAVQTPAAPTAKRSPEARPRFPYIEADLGRINFKIGQEKKAFSLMDADFALWLESESQWSMRLKAQPMRTDRRMSDAGTLRISGTFQRGPDLRQTPVNLKLELLHAQLGQLTALVYGRDRGWRGEVNISGSAAGTPGNLMLAADASVGDFRRYDISTGSSLSLAAHCSAQFQAAALDPQDHSGARAGSLSGVSCQAPMGNGMVIARGTVHGLQHPSSYSLSLVGQDVPMQTMLELLKRTKKNVAADLAATGDVDAAFTLRKSAGDDRGSWAGGGSTSSVVLRSSLLQPEMKLAGLSFAVAQPGVAAKKKLKGAKQVSVEPRLSLQPFALPLGEPTPVAGSAWVSREGYHLGLQGDARIERLLQTAQAFGLRAPQARALGNARIDVAVDGGWSGFVPPAITGTGQLRSVTAELHGFAAPLVIPAATVAVTAAKVTVQNLTAAFPNSHMTWQGMIEIARNCDSLEQCAVRFDLTADQILTDEANVLLNPTLEKKPWYQLLGDNKPHSSLLSRINATGRISTNRLVMKSLTAGHVAANLEITPGKVTLSSLEGDVLGGKHSGTWVADFTGPQPAYTGSGKLDHVVMAQAAALMGDDWASGTAGGTYRVTTSGWSAAELIQSAKGTMDFDWHDGLLHHVAIAGASLKFRRFSGELALNEKTFTLKSRLDTPLGLYNVSGTANTARQLQVRLVRDPAHVFVVTGTLAKPRVQAQTQETRAELKE